MPTLKFNPNYKQWKEDYATEPVYTRKEFNEALIKQAERLRVSRVIQSFTGRIGPNESVAMQILAIHETPEGLMVIVK